MEIIRYEDIISGERVISLCDFVICTKRIVEYHANLNQYVTPFNLLYIDTKPIDSDAMNRLFIKHSGLHIKLFIYTHLLNDFIQYVLPHMTHERTYSIYLHNSDHGLDAEQANVLRTAPHITTVYAQNISIYEPPKFKLLPIGIANSMFGHGNLRCLHDAIQNASKKKRTKGLFIQFGPTYPYRNTVIEQMKALQFPVHGMQNYASYLENMSWHRFCLCVRGNGIACHREWEALYLGVVPVIVNNNHTRVDAYVQYLRDLGIPFLEIKDDTFEKYNDAYFDEALYLRTLSDVSIAALKLEHFS